MKTRTRRAKQSARTARRFARNENDERAIAAGCRFSERQVEYVADFFRSFLRHSKGRWAGEPFELQPWQRDELIGPLFGWIRPDGSRRFRRGYAEIAKKNGKSTIGAAVGAYMMLADGEIGAHVFSLATDKDQASIVHGEAISMIDASPDLRRRVSINRSTRNLWDQKTRSIYRALSSEPKGKQGLDMHCGIIDELHVWDYGRELFECVRWAGAARRQPLLLMLTTAGVYNPHHICWQEHEYARRVLDDKVEKWDYFALIKAADKGDDWTDPAVHRKANPSLGVTLDPDEMAGECADAQDQPRLENAFKRYRLNIWTQQVTRWIKIEQWNACAGSVDEATLVGLPCWGGLDLSSTLDLTAYALCWRLPPAEEGGSASYFVRVRFFVPEENAAEREKRDKVPYLQWGRAGHLFLTPGNVVDYGFVQRQIRADAERYSLQDVAFDPHNATQTAIDLEAAGVPMVSHRQGFISMNEPSKEYERCVISGMLIHEANPVLDWCVENAAVNEDPAGNIKPDKKKSRERVDGVVAAIMSISRAMHADPPKKPTVYRKRGLLMLD